MSLFKLRKSLLLHWMQTYLKPKLKGQFNKLCSVLLNISVLMVHCSSIQYLQCTVRNFWGIWLARGFDSFVKYVVNVLRNNSSVFLTVVHFCVSAMTSSSFSERGFMNMLMNSQSLFRLCKTHCAMLIFHQGTIIMGFSHKMQQPLGLSSLAHWYSCAGLNANMPGTHCSWGNCVKWPFQEKPVSLFVF